MHHFLATLKSDFPRVTLRHYRAMWNDTMCTHMADVVPLGWLVWRIYYPERQEKQARNTVSQQGYHKDKFLLLVITLSFRISGVQGTAPLLCVWG